MVIELILIELVIEKSKICQKLKLTKPSRLIFLSPRPKQLFFSLQKAFIKAPILYHFNSKSHILIETNASSYAIDRVLSQLTLDKSSSSYVTLTNPIFSKSDISQQYLIPIFFRKMILAKTLYKTHNSEHQEIISRSNRLGGS